MREFRKTDGTFEGPTDVKRENFPTLAFYIISSFPLFKPYAKVLSFRINRNFPSFDVSLSPL